MANETYIIIAGHRLMSEAVAMLEPERTAIRNGFSPRTPQAVLRTMLGAYVRLDRGIAHSIETSGLIPACARGCSWCCHGVKVNVSIPEALVIAERLATSGQGELVQRVVATAERRRTLNTDDLFQRGEPCPFLGQSGECGIYDVRPLACRRHCCLDAKECESAVRQPKHKLPVQQHAAANAAGVMSAIALAAALEDVGLDFRTFELATAVAVGLQKHATESWLSCKSLFEEAVRPVDEIDRKIARTDLAQHTVSTPSLHKKSWKSSSKKKRSASRRA